MTECLVRAGLAVGAPPNLIPANAGNPRGHFELRDIVAANDSILQALGSRWDAPDFDGAALDGAELDPVRTELTRILADQLPPTGWVLKDPRLCLLYALYRPIFDVKPKIVHVVREPSAVVESLRRRDLVDPALGRELWERYNSDAVELSGGADVTIAYDDLVGDPRRTFARVLEALQGLESLSEADPGVAQEVVDLALRRSSDARTSTTDPMYVRLLRRTRPDVVSRGEQLQIVDAARCVRRWIAPDVRAPETNTSADAPSEELSALSVTVWDRSHLDLIATGLEVAAGWRTAVVTAASGATPNRREAARDRIVAELPRFLGGDHAHSLEARFGLPGNPGLWATGYVGELAALLGADRQDHVHLVTPDAESDARRQLVVAALRAGEVNPLATSTSDRVDSVAQRCRDEGRSVLVVAPPDRESAIAAFGGAATHVPVHASSAGRSRAQFMSMLTQLVHSMSDEDQIVVTSIALLGPSIVAGLADIVPVIDLGADALASIEHSVARCS